MTDGHKYDDIINLEHPTSKRHPRMSAMDRAAQFAPFSALTGYDDMVVERARITGSRMELDDMQKMALDESMTYVLEHLSERPQVKITWFIKDARKSGGHYQEIEDAVQNVEVPNRMIILRNGLKIPMDDILEILVVK